MSWKGIKTQFIKDRMKETAWEDRGYINDLASIEQTILQRGTEKFYSSSNAPFTKV